VAILFQVTLLGWTVASFFIWLIVLIMGRVPGALYDATTALARYGMRYYAYYLLVTPAYPWGLFGDRAAPPAPALAQPFPPAAAPMPSEPAAAPGEPGAPEEPSPAETTLVSPAEPPPPAPAEAEAGAEPAAPAETEPAATPAAPRGLLTLSSGARGVLTLFIVLGVLYYVGAGVASAVYSGKGQSEAETLQSLSEAHDSLIAKGQKFQQDVGACASAPQGQQLSCVQTADRDLAAAFETFAGDVAALEFPASSRAEAREVERLGRQFAGAMRQLVAAPTPEEYTRLAAGTDQIGSSFDQRYQALVNSLAT
jgi:hypothetical protein